MNDHLTTSNPQSVAPVGNPFRHRAFTVIWIATIVSNIGGWMYSMASGWLMTSLDSNAFIVSMIDPKNRIDFLHALGQNSRERRRDGAYDWGIFEDPDDDGRFIETFLTDSWLEHLRLHRRVTKADLISDQAVRRFQIGDGPKITHLISAQRN
jgi:hypothetical protein